MAVTLGYVEVPFTQRLTSLAAATRHDFAAETIYIPQTTSRAFKAVWIEAYFQQNNTVATNFTSVLLGIKLAAVAFDDATQTQTFTNSGEINSWTQWRRDVTSYFTTNFGSGASQTAQVGIQIGGISSINLVVKLCILYEYDTSDDTRIKLVKIPIESVTGSLTTSYVEIGTDQVPNLDSFLPEGSKTYRHIWFEVEQSDNQSGTTDYQHGMRLDSGGSDDLDGTHEAFANASMFYKRIWRPTVSTNATHKVYSRTTNVAAGSFPHQSVILCVSYEYSESGSSSFMNSLQLLVTGYMGLQTGASGDKERTEFQFQVQEPNVALVQSAIQLWAGDNSGATMNILCGGQSSRGYTHGTATVDMGPYVVMHRIDSGGAQGSGLTLARGLNKLTLDYYASTAGCRTAGAILFLNYTSDKASGGSHKHNKTCPFLIAANAGGTAMAITVGGPIAIPESDYWLTNHGYVHGIAFTSALADNLSGSLSAELQSGEGAQAGWVPVSLLSDVQGDTELGESYRMSDATHLFKQWPSDPRYGRMDIETSRTFATLSTAASRHMVVSMTTYHSITVTKEGTVSNYADADGAGLTVNLYHSVEDYRVANVTTTTGGDWTFTWYDDTSTGKLIAYVFEDSTHVGAGEKV